MGKEYVIPLDGFDLGQLLDGLSVSEGKPVRPQIPRLRNYLEIDARNRSLGVAGEQFVVEFERRRLFDAGRRAKAGVYNLDPRRSA